MGWRSLRRRRRASRAGSGSAAWLGGGVPGPGLPRRVLGVGSVDGTSTRLLAARLAPHTGRCGLAQACCRSALLASVFMPLASFFWRGQERLTRVSPGLLFCFGDVSTAMGRSRGRLAAGAHPADPGRPRGGGARAARDARARVPALGRGRRRDGGSARRARGGGGRARRGRGRRDDGRARRAAAARRARAVACHHHECPHRDHDASSSRAAASSWAI